MLSVYYRKGKLIASQRQDSTLKKKKYKYDKNEWLQWIFSKSKCMGDEI